MPPNDTSLYGPEEVRDWWKRVLCFPKELTGSFYEARPAGLTRYGVGQKRRLICILIDGHLRVDVTPTPIPTGRQLPKNTCCSRATEDRVRLLSGLAGQLQSARQSACLAVPAYRRCICCSRSDRSKRLVPSGWSASSCTCRLG